MSTGLPLLFENLAICKKRFVYQVPYVKWVRDLCGVAYSPYFPRKRKVKVSRVNNLLTYGKPIVYDLPLDEFKVGSPEYELYKLAGLIK